MRMSLSDWVKNGWLERHRPSAGEIQRLLELADRDVKTSQVTEPSIHRSAANTSAGGTP
jgi:hypothetical protein